MKEKQAAPFKILLVDGESRRWVIAAAGDNVKAKFHEFHGERPSPRAALWIIPLDAKVSDELTYSIPKNAPNWSWVRIGEIR